MLTRRNFPKCEFENKIFKMSTQILNKRTTPIIFEHQRIGSLELPENPTYSIGADDKIETLASNCWANYLTYWSNSLWISQSRMKSETFDDDNNKPNGGSKFVMRQVHGYSDGERFSLVDSTVSDWLAIEGGRKHFLVRLKDPKIGPLILEGPSSTQDNGIQIKPFIKWRAVFSKRQELRRMRNDAR